MWARCFCAVFPWVKVFSSFIISHFVYGSETWPLTQGQGDRLETMYNSYLRQILGVSIADHHSLEHLRGRCQVLSLRWLLARRRLSWLGHMARMHEERYPHQALFSRLCGAKHSKGRLAQSFVSIVCKDLQAVGIPSAQGGWMSALRTGLNGGLALGSYPHGRVPWCPFGNSLLGIVGCKLRHKLFL